MTRQTADPMNDDRFDREVRRLLEWDVSQIPNAPSQADMIVRLGPATEARGARGGMFRNSPAFRVIVVLGLLGAVMAGAFATGALRNPDNPLVVAPSPRLETMTVAGSEVGSASLRLTLALPDGWSHSTYAAKPDTADPRAKTAFFLSVVDNTYADPCAHIERSPKIGTSVEALAAALGDIPGTTASQPVRTTIAGYDATLVEVQIPEALPCIPSQFYLWKEAGDAQWWALAVNELISVWIVEVGGYRVAITSRLYPETSEAAKAELQQVLQSIVFDIEEEVSAARCVKACACTIESGCTGRPAGPDDGTVTSSPRTVSSESAPAFG